jgi:site-specific DNA recombinase
MKPQVVALYARVSSEAQAKDHTIDSQVKAILEQSEKEGFGIPEQLRFIDDGYSGSTLARPGLERMRDFAARGLVEIVFVHSPDRLSRDFINQILLTEELNRFGVELRFINRPLGSTPEDAMLLQMQGIMAQYEKTKLLERGRRGRRHAAQCGSVSALSAAPYGFRYVGKFQGGGQARLEIDPEQGAVVRQIFDWVVFDRLSFREIARRLLERGIPSPQNKPIWCSASICHLLANPAYAGEAAFGRQRSVAWQKPLRVKQGAPEYPRIPCRRVAVPEAEWIRIPCPALVDKAQFAMVKELLEQNKKMVRGRRARVRNLLHGLMVCQQCRYAYTQRVQYFRDAGGGTRTYRYYECSGRNHTNDHKAEGARVRCSNRQIKADYLDNSVWDAVKELLKEPARVEEEYLRRLREVESQAGLDLTPLRRQITRAKGALARLIDIYVEGQIDKAEFEPRAGDMRRQITHLESQEKEVAEASQVKQEIRFLVGQLSTFAKKIAAGLEDADWETRRAVIRTLVKKIEVYLDHVTVVFRVGETSMPNGPPPMFSQHCSDADPCQSRANDGMGRRTCYPDAPTHPSPGPAGTQMNGIQGKKQDKKAFSSSCISSFPMYPIPV